MGEQAVSRNFLQAMARAAVGVAVLWAVMHFFFAWQDGKASETTAEAKVLSAVTTR